MEEGGGGLFQNAFNRYNSNSLLVFGSNKRSAKRLRPSLTTSLPLEFKSKAIYTGFLEVMETGQLLYTDGTTELVGRKTNLILFCMFTHFYS